MKSAIERLADSNTATGSAALTPEGLARAAAEESPQHALARRQEEYAERHAMRVIETGGEAEGWLLSYMHEAEPVTVIVWRRPPDAGKYTRVVVRAAE